MTPRAELEQLDRDWLEEWDRQNEPISRLLKRQFASTLGFIAGMVLVVFGLWLDQLGINDVQLERRLFPWPLVSILVGLCLVFGSLVFVIRYVNPRLRAFVQAKSLYDARREQLLEEIYGGAGDAVSTDAGPAS